MVQRVRKLVKMKNFVDRDRAILKCKFTELPKVKENACALRKFCSTNIYSLNVVRQGLQIPPSTGLIYHLKVLRLLLQAMN